MMKPKTDKSLRGIDLILIAFAILGFWYSNHCIEKGSINIRSIQVDSLQSPIMFWMLILLHFCGGIFCLYVALFKKKNN